jgi:ketosteroid isomerase-like protein
MSATDNIDLIKGAYAAFGRGDLDAILAVLTDDIDWAADTSSDGAPWYGIRKGKAAVAAFFEDIGKTIDIQDFTPVTFAANEDGDVFAIVRWGWCSRQTGGAANMNLHHWWRITNGKISYFRGAEDTPNTLAALGK